MMDKTIQVVRCTGCNKASWEVERIIVFTPGFNICNECVSMCNHIIENERKKDQPND